MPTISSMHSFRGGIGKSNLTANLAGSMVQQDSEGLFLLQYPEHPFSQGVREITAQFLSVAGDTSERKA